MPTQNHLHRLHAQGERRYQQLRKKLEPRYNGQIVAVEAESGEYVVGKDELQVALEAVKKFPGKRFTFFRVGAPAVHKLRTQFRATMPDRSLALGLAPWRAILTCATANAL